MFKPTKPEDPGTSPEAASPQSSPTAPRETQSRPASGGRSVIGGDLKVVGNLISKGDLQIEGEVEGDVNAASVTVGRSAKLVGGIKADRVEVQGSVKGQVDAGSVNFASSARMEGDVVHDSLSMEGGAYINGHCKRRG